MKDRRDEYYRSEFAEISPLHRQVCFLLLILGVTVFYREWKRCVYLHLHRIISRILHYLKIRSLVYFAEFLKNLISYSREISIVEDNDQIFLKRNSDLG